MAFLPEDGTGVPGANSYATVEYAEAYFAERGRASEFAGTDPDRQGWLIQATDYIERFRERFKSVTAFPSQSLSFPRVGDIAGTVWFPEVLRQATCEYAARAKLGPLAPDTPNTPTMALVSKKIGPIEKRYEVINKGAPVGKFRSYPMADSLLVTLLRRSGNRVIK